MLEKIQQLRRSRLIKDWGQFILLALCLFAGRSMFADWNRIPSESMEPTLYVGDLVWVNRLAYDLKIPFTTRHIKTWQDPKAGDIVVFYEPEGGKRMVKRVIGTPGDTIEMRENRLMINGAVTAYEPQAKPLIYPIAKSERGQAIFATEHLADKPHHVMALPFQVAMRSFGPVTVPHGQFLMLGDNRDNSADFRYFGLVDRDQILGRAERVLISWDKDNTYKPRFKRFFEALA